MNRHRRGSPGRQVDAAGGLGSRAWVELAPADPERLGVADGGDDVALLDDAAGEAVDTLRAHHRFSVPARLHGP